MRYIELYTGYDNTDVVKSSILRIKGDSSKVTGCTVNKIKSWSGHDIVELFPEPDVDCEEGFYEMLNVSLYSL